MTDTGNGKYTVYFLCEEDRPGIQAFETDSKPWDMDESDWETLAQEVGEWLYENTDGWEWWKPDEALAISLFWGEGDSEGSAESLRGNFMVAMYFAPTFSARKVT